MIISKIEKGISLSQRIDGEVKREEISFNDFQPYFYVLNYGIEFMSDQINQTV
jgi:hypothetical protein